MLPYCGAFLFYSSDQLLSALLLVYHLLDGYFNQYSIFPVCNSMVWCDHAVWCPMWDVSTWSSVWKSESILFHMWLRVQRWWCLCQYILQVTSCWETFSDCQRDKIQQHGESVTLKLKISASNPGCAVSGHLSTPLPGLTFSQKRISTLDHWISEIQLRSANTQFINRAVHRCCRSAGALVDGWRVVLLVCVTR